MEVHHHPHVPKKLKDFFLEFLMIFLAVTLGFFAEGYREHLVEKSREKEFMESMVKEMKSDSIQTRQILKDTIRTEKLDSLSVLLLSNDYSPKKVKKIYELYYKYGGNYEAMVFSRNTLSQLKNSGNMRLIRKRNVVDSLNVLDNKITTIEDQLNAERAIMLDNYNDTFSIFDMSYFVNKEDKFIQMKDVILLPDLKFLTNDKTLLKKFGAKMKLQSGVMKNYFVMLNDFYNYQNRLIPSIEKEYDLEK